MPAIASVIIPAHDEEALLGATLSTLLDGAAPWELDVVVVCNGCTDSTPEISRSFASQGVRTVVIPVPSKTAALNAGDRAANVFPRIYLDADVLLGVASVRLLAAALSAGAQAAAPRAMLDTSRSSLGVRLYSWVWSRLGHVARGLGSGVYCLSEGGHARFGIFPDIVADDFFVYCMFSGSTRVVPDGAYSIVRAPRTLRDLARRRIRIEQGNAQVRALGLAAEAPQSGLHDVMRAQPWLAPAAVAVYLTVNMWAKRRASQRSVSAIGWQRDQASRTRAATPSEPSRLDQRH